MRLRLIVVAVLLLAMAAPGFAQQQMTQTVTKDNKNCNGGCSVIDIPELNGDPSAIVFVTPLGRSAALNPHPIGAYFMYLKKWSVFNLDGASITEDATYTVEYYVNSDANHFVYVVPPGGGACIDNAALNGNANAQVRLFPTGAPGGGTLFNRENAKADYTPATSRWCISNVNGSQVPGGTAYSVAVIDGRGAVSQASTAAIAAPTIDPGARTGSLALAPATLAPQLAPLTVVARAEWPVPQFPLLPGGKRKVVGPGTCEPLISKYTNPAILATDTVIVTGQAADFGNLLTWTASVENGALQIFACTNVIVSGTAIGVMLHQAVDLTGKKINILVLR